MSPAYARTYAASHSLSRPLRNPKTCLLQKLDRCLSVPLPPPVQSAVRLGSALEATSLFPSYVGTVDIILTSPPYLNSQTYAKDAWLRHWFLGFNYRDLLCDYIETGKCS